MKRPAREEMIMKKFCAFILVLVVLAVGYGLMNGYIKVENVEQLKGLSFMTSTANAAPKSQESALKGAERIDDQIWSGIRNGHTDTVRQILMGMGMEDTEGFIRERTNEARTMNSRYVHILCEAGDVCVAEAVHYLVTTSGSKWSESNSGYWLYLRKENGKWQPGTFTEKEVDALNEQYNKLFPSALLDAQYSGRNCCLIGNKMWTRRDGVESGCFLTNVAYVYQEEKGSVVIGVAMANGEKVIRNMKSLTVTVKDDKLGQVLKVKSRCTASVLPGTVEIYEIRVPASKVRKGTWTYVHTQVHSDY